MAARFPGSPDARKLGKQKERNYMKTSPQAQGHAIRSRKAAPPRIELRRASNEIMAAPGMDRPALDVLALAGLGGPPTFAPPLYVGIQRFGHSCGRGAFAPPRSGGNGMFPCPIRCFGGIGSVRTAPRVSGGGWGKRGMSAPSQGVRLPGKGAYKRRRWQPARPPMGASFSGENFASGPPNENRTIGRRKRAAPKRFTHLWEKCGRGEFPRPAQQLASAPHRNYAASDIPRDPREIWITARYTDRLFGPDTIGCSAWEAYARAAESSETPQIANADVSRIMGIDGSSYARYSLRDA